jgi:hypothetical protein
MTKTPTDPALERDKQLAQKIVDEIMTNGAGQRADRLVLMTKENRDLGGWCERALCDRIAMVITGSRLSQ